MKVTLIPILFNVFSIIHKRLIKRLEDLEIREVETIQTTVLLGSARILRVRTT